MLSPVSLRGGAVSTKLASENNMFCCNHDSGTFAEGCGPLVRNWIQSSNGTFKGVTVIDGHSAEEWDVQGFALNRYWSSVDADNIPIKLDQGGFVNVYDTATFKLAPDGLPTETFAVPPTCSTFRICKSRRPCNFR